MADFLLSARGAATLLACLGAAFAIAALSEQRERRRWSARVRRTSGTIMGHRRVASDGAFRSWHAPIVRYQTDTGEEREGGSADAVHSVANDDHTTLSRAIGRTITIRYDPAVPNQVFLSEPPTGLLALGLAVGAFTAAFIAVLL
jgi:hypothetical protein